MALFLNSVPLSDKNTSGVLNRKTTLSLNSFKTVFALALRMGMHSTQRVMRSWNTSKYLKPNLLLLLADLTLLHVSLHRVIHFRPVV